ncbi:Cu(I)-responsive transcriptional regulator [Azohydromonas caseinilytica]|uniref:Cu(I)-responsive transcriptional regulator n=1 Tax=Azohydromonas caseinilytica TaxID=2728836 RepID=A0A848FGD0_9BURK|nr:Cu(I)-responsive transcriptional regulator [Azohydromonas caseinilytica]NML16931.1 Cu(I)-responsive transcriptional regulator [Azohydromonas caseinilytica]
MNIGEAAEAAGVSAKMIRHYEQIGLLPAARRTESGYRQYAEHDVSVLRFIRQSRRLGFSMQQISELLGLWSNSRRSSRQVKDLALKHIADLEQKMREMAAMKQDLERLAASCRGDDLPDCTIIEGLASHNPPPPVQQVKGNPAHNKDRTRQPGPKVHAAAAASSSDLLVAWTHQAHAGHVGH